MCMPLLTISIRSEGAQQRAGGREVFRGGGNTLAKGLDCVPGARRYNETSIKKYPGERSYFRRRQDEAS
jgi:hypothetical protein